MFLLFAYTRYYPEGASNDFVCKYETFTKCLEEIMKSSFEYNDVYDVMNDNWYKFHEPRDSDKKLFHNEEDDVDSIRKDYWEEVNKNLLEDEKLLKIRENLGENDC